MRGGERREAKAEGNYVNPWTHVESLLALRVVVSRVQPLVGILVVVVLVLLIAAAARLVVRAPRSLPRGAGLAITIRSRGRRRGRRRRCLL